MIARFLVLLVTLVLCTSIAPAQTEQSLWATNFGPAGVSGTVKALKKWGDTLVVAGDISGLRLTAAFSQGFIMFDLVDRSWKLQTGDQLEFGDEVRAVEVMPNGDLVVGGDFSFTSDGMTLANIAVYRKDGTWSTLSGDTSDLCDGPVNALLLYNGTLYIGGEFQSIGNTDPNLSYLLAMWDENQGFSGYLGGPLAFGAFGGGVPAVHALTAGQGPSGISIDKNIYIGGDFVRTPGDTIGGLARVSTTSREVFGLSGGGTNGPVYALWMSQSLSYNEKLFIGGEFTVAGDSVASNCVLHEVVDMTWHPMGDGLNGPVHVIEQYPEGTTSLHFAGDFDSSGTTPVGAFPMWPLFSSGWSTTDVTTDGPVYALEGIENDFLAVGGEFEFAGDSSLFYGVFLTEDWDVVSDSVLWSLGDAIEHYDNAFERVNDVAADGNGNFYAIGGFTHAAGALCNNIAKWDGEKWYPLGEGLASAGPEIAVRGDTVYAVRRLPSPAFNTHEVLMWDGASWTAISPELPGTTINGLEIDTLGHVYLCGRNLDTIGFSGQHGIIKWDGSQWLEVGGSMDHPTINPIVNDMVIDSLTNDVYVCGQFETVNGVFADGVAWWDGAFWHGLGSEEQGDGRPEVIELSPAGVPIVTGAIQRPEFTELYQNTFWLAYAGGISVPDVTDLLTIGCHVYITGDPLQYVNTEADPFRVYNIGRWDGLEWDSLAGGTNGGVMAIEASGNQLAVAGDFTISGGHYTRGFTIWNGVVSGADASDLTLLTPTLNDTLEYGTVFEFTWDTATTVPEVVVEVSLDSGATWEIIHNRADAKIGRLPWVVPDTNAPFCKVRVSNGNAPCAAVEANFTFTITADSALESWWLTHAGGTYYKEPFLPGYTGLSFGNTETNMWPDSLWKSIDYSDFSDPPDTIENFPDWYLYCDAYGSDWCYRNGNPDRPRSKAIKHWQGLLREWGGSCLGLSTASLLWLYGNEFNTDLIIPYEPLFYLGYNTLTRNAANKHWIYQNGKKHLEHDDDAQVLTPYETMDLIRADFTASFARTLSFSWRDWNDKLDDDSVVVDSVWKTSGHNVVPYHIRNVPDSQGIYYMFFYDPNAPTSKNEWVRIDSINGTWLMPSYYPNDTNSRFIPRLPINDWYGLADDDRVTTGLKRTASSHFVTVYTSATEDVMMTDSLGNQIGWVNNEAVVNGLQGGPIFTDDPDYRYDYPKGYLVPAGAYDVELSNNEEALPFYSMFDDSVSYFYRRDSAATFATDKFRIDNGVSIVQPSGLLTGVAIGAIRTTDSTERYMELSEMTFSPIDSVDIVFDSAGAITISVTGVAKAYKLLLWNSDAAMADDEMMQSTGYTTIFADHTHKIVPPWGTLDILPTLLLKDMDQDGLFEDTSVLAIATDIEDDLPELPETYTLSQNYPNPFNPSTTIDFSLPVAGEVTLEIINILGQRVKLLVDKELAAGGYSVEWNGTNESGQSVATGIYFYRLSADGFSTSRKMLLLK